MLKTLQSAIPFLPDPGPAVSIIRLEGPIGRMGGHRKGLTAQSLETAITRAFAQPSLAAVALAINSPGGSPVQARLIADRIRHLADEKNVSVFAFCEDVAASGGYMLALAADEIFADVSSLVGSIGVIGAGFGAVEALQKLGLERRVYTAGDNKLRLDPFQPEKEADRAFVAHIQKAIHDEFIAFVKARRAGKLDGAAKLFEGDVFIARDAKAHGLIDGIGHAREVLKERYGPKVEFRTFTASRPSLAERLLGGATDSLIASVEERALWARYGL